MTMNIKSMAYKSMMIKAKKMKRNGKTLTVGQAEKILTLADTSKLINATRYI